MVADCPEKEKRKSHRGRGSHSRPPAVLVREVFFHDDQVRERLTANENEFLNEIKHKFPGVRIDLGKKRKIKVSGSPSADKVKLNPKPVQVLISNS